MMTQAEAEAFAKEWRDAWNARDLPRVLAHYTDDFEMSSPFIAHLTGESSGRLVGKDQVQAYWEAALRRMPQLQVELLDVFTGASSITLLYRTNTGRTGAEVLFFNEDKKVYRGAAHYRELEKVLHLAGMSIDDDTKDDSKGSGRLAHT